MAEVPDIDRLIEEGLSLYGQGDLDRALLVWEQALAIDPDNEQANSYVDYVRANYDLLNTDPGAAGSSEDGYELGGDDPGYQIEIVPGEVVPAAATIARGPAPMYMDPLDEGWTLEGDEPVVEGTLTIAAAKTRTGDRDRDLIALPRTTSDSLTLELEADEPPDLPPRPLTLPLSAPAEVSFETPTREYDSTSRVVAEFKPEETPALPAEVVTPTPVDFDTVTSIVERKRGFVKPTQDRPVSGTEPPPELKMTLRTPESHAEPERARRASSDLLASLPTPRPAPGTVPPPERTQERTQERIELPRTTTPDSGQLRAARSTLRPPAEARPPADSKPPSNVPRVAGHSTRDYPASPRPPAPSTSPPPSIDMPGIEMPSITDSPTRDFTGQDTAELKLADLQYQVVQTPSEVSRDLASLADALNEIAATATPAPPVLPITTPLPRATSESDFDTKTTEAPRKPAPSPLDISISAPTRDLGLRSLATNPDDEPTVRARGVDVAQMLGDNAPTGVHLPRLPDEPEPTDPIELRTREILATIDGDAVSPTESKEDQTRRRIMALFEGAAAWSRAGDLDRAIIAVDLAMSEDPNSALAQKLIHRNRDTIMFVFNNYLGDMTRTPVLAKPLHELSSSSINPRAAFLLSRIDGLLSLEEILDVSGMPRLEAFRYLCQLFLRGILR